MVKAIYAGSFDPITRGHLDIISRANEFCDELIIAIGLNPLKKSFFSEDERLNLIHNSLQSYYGTSNYQMPTTFSGLLVNYAKEIGASILIRGIRSVSDFEYEINLANINKVLAPDIETIFLPTSPELAVVSSSMVKEIAKCGGEISKFVEPCVVEAIKNKLA